VRNRKKTSLTHALSSGKNRIKRLIGFGVLLLVLYIFGFGDYGIYQYYQLRREKKELQAEIAGLENEKRLLEEEKELLRKRDPAYLDRIAREKYGLVKPGEKIYKLVPKSNNR